MRSAMLTIEIDLVSRLRPVTVFSMRDPIDLIEADLAAIAALVGFLEVIDQQVTRYNGRFRCALVMSGCTARQLAGAGAGPLLRQIARSGCVELAFGSEHRVSFTGLPLAQANRQLRSGWAALSEIADCELHLFGDVDASLHGSQLTELVRLGAGRLLFRPAGRGAAPLIEDRRTGVVGIPLDGELSASLTRLLSGDGIAGREAQMLRDAMDRSIPAIVLPVLRPATAAQQLPRLLHAILADPRSRLLTVAEGVLRRPIEGGDLAAAIQPWRPEPLAAGAARQLMGLLPLLPESKKNLSMQLQPVQCWHTLLARHFYDLHANPHDVERRRICGSVTHDRFVHLSTAVAALELRLLALHRCLS